MFRKSFSSLRQTYIFMICFGLLMGVVFPFYSALFFGSRAFTPLYVIGCLTAGLLVGSFSYFCIKQSLKFYLERQLETLKQIAGGDELAIELHSGKDALQVLMDYHEKLIGRVLVMIDDLTAITAEIVPLYQKLKDDAHTMTAANSEQVRKSRAALQAVEGVRDSLQQMRSHIEQIAARSGEQVAVSAQMSATIKTVAENMQEYSASVQETSASVEEMLASVRETEENVAGLACSTEQTAASIFEIDRSISAVRDHVNRTATCSEDVQRRAIEGMEAMAATLRAMHEIEQSSNISFDSISRLAVQSEQVGQVLAVIHDVVEQTNLLSLNASIISAQAGERGKAFAVVAGEVRSLAHRTAQSAGQIDMLLKTIREETIRVHQNVSMGKEKATEGVKVAALTNESLGKIGESAAEVLEMVRRIVSATDEEASGSQLISKEAAKNIDRVKQVTRAVQEQNLSSSQIVATLRRMEELSARIATAIRDQVRGIQLYTEGLQKDNDNIRKLTTTALAEGERAGKVVAFVEETGVLIEANADKSSGIVADIEAIAQMTLRLKEEMAGFRNSQRD
jgi:methyl-accepting chemotaxis protein